MDTFDTDIAACNSIIDDIMAWRGIALKPDKSYRGVNELEKDNARLRALLELQKRDNNRLKRWIATI